MNGYRYLIHTRFDLLLVLAAIFFVFAIKGYNSIAFPFAIFLIYFGVNTMARIERMKKLCPTW